MPADINLATFIQRADQGAGRIRLSGKATDQPQLSAHKGTLAGRVVEWFRGSKDQRAEENQAVARLFVDAIRDRHDAETAHWIESALSRQIEEGKPLTSRDVKQLEQAAAHAHTLIQGRRDIITEVARAQVGPDSLGAGFAGDFFETLGTPGCAVPLLDPDSEASMAIRSVIEDKLQRGVVTPAPDQVDAVRADALGAAQSALIQPLKDHLFKLAACDPAATSALLSRPHVEIAGYQFDSLLAFQSTRSLSAAQQQDFAGAVVGVVEDLLKRPGDEFEREVIKGGEPRIVTNRDRAVELLRRLMSTHLYQALGADERMQFLSAQRDAGLASIIGHPALDPAEAARVTELALTDAAQAQSDIVALAGKRDPVDPRQVGLAMAGFEDIERAYAVAQGGDGQALPGAAVANRQRLAEVRERCSDLLDEGGSAGSEEQALISSGMRTLTREMIDRAVRELGPPPCDFAAVTLGSTSRGEASPYSDIEFGFVLPEGLSPEVRAQATDHLQRVAAMVRFQVRELGESPGLETPLGLHWDEANNSPAEDRNFIGTPTELVDWALAWDDDLEMPGNHLAFTMFSNAEWLDGQEGLVQSFNAKTHEHFDSTGDGARFGHWLLNEGLSLAGTARPSNDGEVDVKKLSRLPMMLAHGLCLQHGVHTLNGVPVHSTQMRIDALVDHGVLTRTDGDLLAEAFSELGRIRNAAHIEARKGEDVVSISNYQTLPGVIRTLAMFEERLARHLNDPTLRF